MSISNTRGLAPVLTAVGGNTVVAIIKFVAAFASGSSVLFSEAIHSVADTTNQLLLLIGLRRSQKPATNNFNYGYGSERFFWSLLSACSIFFVGAGVTLFKGIAALIHPEPIEWTPAVGLILGVSFLIEGYTFWIAARELQRNRPDGSWKERLTHADPTTLAVFLEDGVALLGIFVAIASTTASFVTWNPVWDAAGSIVIGCLLGVVAILLILKNRPYLVGQSMPEEMRDAIIAALTADPCIDRVLDFKSTELDVGVFHFKCEIEFNGTAILHDPVHVGSFRTAWPAVRDDYGEFVRFLTDYTGRIPRLIGQEIDRIEAMIRKRFPQIRHLDIEIN